MSKLFIRDNSGTWKKVPVAVTTPGCILSSSNIQNVFISSFSYPLSLTFISFDTTVRDTNGFKTSSTEITVPAGMGGLYRISPRITYELISGGGSGSYGTKTLAITKNGTQYYLTTCGRNEGLPARLNGSILVKADAGDVFKVGTATNGGSPDPKHLEVGSQVSFTRVSGF